MSGERNRKKGEPLPKQVKMSYLFQLAENRKSTLYMAILFSILSGLCTFVPYVMVFRTILIIFTSQEARRETLMYGLIAAVFIILKFVFKALSAGMTHVGAYQMLYAVRKKICAHLGKVNLGFFTGNSTGEIKKILMEDVDRLEQFIAHQIPDITVAMVVPLTVLVYLFTINIPMALVLLVPIVITFIIQLIMLLIVKKPFSEYPAILGRLNSVIMQFINGMPVMKAYGLTADTYQEYAAASEEFNDLWKRVARLASPFSAINKVLIESGIVFTVPIGGWLYLRGDLELSAYVFFIVMSIVFLGSYTNLMNFAQIFQQISAGLGRIKDLMDVPDMTESYLQNQESENSRERQDSYQLCFDHVSFSYLEESGERTRKIEVLRDVNLKLPVGGVTAFVGASGAGKSTAAALIPRFWDVDGGQITIDGMDIREYKMEDLMELVSFVFQEAFMLNDSIYQNIAIGKTGCTREQAVTAAKVAQIHDFIESLPNGYETKIGEEGVKLSGGEKQRICIARAILKDAPIIVFDEATSYTDMENEYKIQRALSALLEGKTTIMIAHRLHTIVSADLICVFDKGEVIESGTHRELLARKGSYASMWNTYTNERNAGWGVS